MEKQEILLIQAIQKGDLERFGELYDQYIKKIYEFIYYKTNHKETAEDICSLVFMKALKNINNFDVDKGTIQAWFYQIARNAVIDHYRTQKKDANIEDFWDLEDGSDIERDIDIKNKLSDVDKYLQLLKPEQREIIILRLWQEYSYREIADILGKTEASVKMSFGRSIKKLRTEMPLLIFLEFVFSKLL